MIKDITISKEYVVIWIPGSTDISLYEKDEFEGKMSIGYYKNDGYIYNEFKTYDEAIKFFKKLWTNIIT
jgi:hypothetical protein